MMAASTRRTITTLPEPGVRTRRPNSPHTGPTLANVTTAESELAQITREAGSPSHRFSQTSKGEKV